MGLSVVLYLGTMISQDHLTTCPYVCMHVCPSAQAVKIALEVKKYLVDHERMDVSQAGLEQILFHIMRGKGFGDEYVRRYQMVTNFNHQRRPLVIFICGSACTGAGG
jgi:2-phosphoglycerate kinase